MRILQQVAIVAFFAVMMALLARDHLLPRWQAQDGAQVSAALLVDAFTDRDDWALVKVAGARVGTMRMVSERRAAGPGFVSWTQLQVDMVGRKALVRAVALANPELELEKFEAVVQAPGLDGEVRARGAASGRELLLEIASPTGARRESLELARPVALSSSLEPLITSGDLIAGEPYLLDVYDPLLQSEKTRLRVVWTGTERIRVGGAGIQARRIEATAGPMVMVVHVDGASNRILRREFGLADTARRTPEGTPFVEGAPTVVLEWLRQIDGMDDAPALMELLPEPAFEAGELRGESIGDPLDAFGLAPALLRNQLDFLGAKKP